VHPVAEDRARFGSLMFWSGRERSQIAVGPVRAGFNRAVCPNDERPVLGRVNRLVALGVGFAGRLLVGGRFVGFLSADCVRRHGCPLAETTGPRVLSRGRFPRWKLPRRDRSVSTSP